MPVNSISKSLLATILSNLWSLLLLLLLTPLYIKFLGIESYGLIGFYTTLIAILGILDAGISTTTTREISWRSVRPQYRGTIPSLMKSLEFFYWFIILGLCLFILIFGWFFGSDWFQTKNIDPEIVNTTFILMILSLMLQVPSGFYTAGLIGLQHQIQNSILVAIFTTLKGVGAVIILWKILPDIRFFFIWQILINLIQIIVMNRFLWKKLHYFNISSEFSTKILKSIRSFTGGMILITGLSLVISQVDKVILSTTVSLVDYSYYMLAWSISSILLVLAIPLVQVFAPRFTRFISNNEEKLLRLDIITASRLAALIILPPSAFLMILSEPILMIWLDDINIATSVSQVLILMIPGSMLIACAYPALQILYSRKRIKPVIIIHIISLIIFLPLIIFAILQYGIEGAALCWTTFGFILFLGYQINGLNSICDKGIFLFIFHNFIIPCIFAFLCASIFGYFLMMIESNLLFIFFLIISMMITCLIIMSMFDNFRTVMFRKINSILLLPYLK